MIESGELFSLVMIGLAIVLMAVVVITFISSGNKEEENRHDR